MQETPTRREKTCAATLAAMGGIVLALNLLPIVRLPILQIAVGLLLLVLAAGLSVWQRARPRRARPESVTADPPVLIKGRRGRALLPGTATVATMALSAPIWRNVPGTALFAPLVAVLLFILFTVVAGRFFVKESNSYV